MAYPPGEPIGYPTPSLKPDAASSGPQSQKPQSKEEGAGEVAASKQVLRAAEDRWTAFQRLHPDYYVEKSTGRVMKGADPGAVDFST